DQHGGVQGVAARGGGDALRAPGRPAGRRDRRARCLPRRGGEGVRRAEGRAPRAGGCRRAGRVLPGAAERLQGAARRRVSRRPADERRRQAAAARAEGRSVDRQGDQAMTDMSPFRQRLAEAVNARHSRLNPFTEQWVKGALSRDQLGAWAAQHYQYVSQFPRWCAIVYGQCPDPDARDFLLENIIEEESGTKHVDLLIRFAEACGVSRAEVESKQQLPTTRGLTAWCFEMSHQAFHVAAAGLLVGLESQVPGI